MRKPALSLCENTKAKISYAVTNIDSTIPLLSKSEISSLSVAVQPGLGWNWLETLKTYLTAIMYIHDFTKSSLKSAFKALIIMPFIWNIDLDK